jgi:hypothetical protein
MRPLLSNRRGAALNRSHAIPSLGAIHWIRPTGPQNTALSLGERGLVNRAEVAATLEISTANPTP